MADNNTTINTGLPYDDNGNLMPGWELNENKDPVWVDGDIVDKSNFSLSDLARTAFNSVTGKNADAAKTVRGQFEPAKDWRVRLSLAPGASYLYKADDAGILEPLKSTNGVIFPYLPAVSVAYNAMYSSEDLTHSNYKIHTYKNSSVDSVTITGDFTAQDSVEANYMLATIHFFRSLTKMFYGQDQNPSRGTPPPLVYLSGHGQYQFDNHPLVVQSFTYSLPTDVDYINAYPNNGGKGGRAGQIDLNPFQRAIKTYATPLQRLLGSKLLKGGLAPNPIFSTTPNIDEVTRMPTKISLSLTCLPVVTRNAVSNNFSLEKYATGSLLQGSKNSTKGGGMW